MAWDLPDGSYNNWGNTTETLPQVANELASFDNLQPGDVIDNITSHVVIFVDWTDSSHQTALVDQEPHTGLTAQQVAFTRAYLIDNDYLPYSYTNTAPEVPRAPGGLTATASASSVSLSWGAAIGASSYRAFRNGTPIASPTGTSYTDSGLSPGRPTATWLKL